MGKKNSKLSAREIEELVQSTHFSSKDLNRWYRGFLDDCPSGSLNKEEFCKLYHRFFPFGDPSDFATYVFNAFDTQENGMIGFKEFINALSATAAGNTEERLQWAFRLYDSDRDGYVTREEVEGVVSAMHRMVGHMTTLREEDEDKEEEETPQERVTRLFENMDTDKDGRISLEDFLRGCKTDGSTAKALALYEGLL